MLCTEFVGALLGGLSGMGVTALNAILGALRSGGIFPKDPGLHPGYGCGGGFSREIRG